MEAAICMMKLATSAKMKRNSCFMLTLGFFRRNLAFPPRSTKEVAYKTLVLPKLEYAAPIWSPHSKLQINQIEKVQRTATRWTCRRWRNTSGVCEKLDELEWPSLEARRDQSSLLLFHNIHCGAVSIEKDKYMTPAHSLKTTRSSHSVQYGRHQAYSDALKNSFFPQTIPHNLEYQKVVFLLLFFHQNFRISTLWRNAQI